MARQSIKLDVSQLAQLAQTIEKMGATAASDLRTCSVAALNQTAQEVYVLARKNITQGMNLSDAYAQSKMEITHATDSRLQASITAKGDRANMTRLARYDATVKKIPMKGGRHRGRGIMCSALGIPAGYKQAGTDVHVTRGTHKFAPSMFMLPLKTGNKTGDKVGVFSRRGRKIKHHYGPAVYQLFRWQIPRMEEEVTGTMRDNLLAQVDGYLNGVFA